MNTEFAWTINLLREDASSLHGSALDRRKLAALGRAFGSPEQCDDQNQRAVHEEAKSMEYYDLANFLEEFQFGRHDPA